MIIDACDRDQLARHEKFGVWESEPARNLHRMSTVFDSGDPDRSRSRETVRVIVEESAMDWSTFEKRGRIVSIDRSVLK